MKWPHRGEREAYRRARGRLHRPFKRAYGRIRSRLPEDLDAVYPVALKRSGVHPGIITLL